jgi:hypothetical protein
MRDDEIDRLREALLKASAELYGGAAGLTDPLARALIEAWARQAREAADAPGLTPSDVHAMIIGWARQARQARSRITPRACSSP